MLRYLPLIVKNSLRNRRRSLLTIGSIAISLCLLSVLMALYQGLFLADATPAQALRMVTHHKVSIAQTMPASYEARIRQVPGVREVTSWQWFGGVYKDARDQRNFFARFAVEPAQFLKVRYDFDMPDDQKAAFIHLRSGCVAGKKLADRFGWKVGDKIPIQGDIFPVNLDLTLVGIYRSEIDNDALFFNLEYLRQLLSGRVNQDRISSFLVLADNKDVAADLPKRIDALFDNAPEPTLTESEQAFGLSFASFLGNLKLFLLAICGAITFTILLVSANTISMSVRERVREVGILKTLGFTRSAILAIILGEAAVIAAIGGALGVALGSGICYLMRQGPSYVQAMATLRITPALALLSLAVALLIGLISSLAPAWSASRTSILDALRATV